MNKFLLTFIIGICLICSSCTDKSLTDHELYSVAVQNSHTINKSKIRNLVTLNHNDSFVSYVDDKVLMTTFHNVPQFYPQNEDIKLAIDVLWLVSYKELESKLAVSSNCSRDRIIQILGAKPGSDYSHLSLLLINPHKLLRPAFSQDPFVNHMTLTLTTQYRNFTKWFYDMKLRQDHPWTSLGYTYDWGSPGDFYGLSEFILLKSSYYHVVRTLTIENFISTGCKVNY